MIKREPLMTEEHFEELINHNQDTINEINNVLQTNPEKYVKIHVAFFDLYMKYKKAAFGKYSLGYDVDAIKEDVSNSIKWFITYQQHPDHNIFRLNIFDHYEGLLQLYAFGSLLKVDQSLLSDLLSVIKNEGGDALFDTLARFVQPDRPVGTKLLFPETYQQLWDVVQSPNLAEQTSGMKKFLKGWYKSMRKTYWHDLHKKAGSYNFSGYWCLEAALVTVLYNIDDSSYRDMPFYPKDMVTYAKSSK
jgi:hypothetical protein